jgi:hypothetical protein
MSEKILLTIGEQIDRAKQGRTQKWIVREMNSKLEATDQINEVDFSNKKKGYGSWSQQQLKALSEVLQTEFVI